MIEALDELQDFQIVNSYDELETAEMVTYLYLAMRIKPLVEKNKISKYEANTICKTLADNFIEEDISLDLMINAVYNYINKTNMCPTIYQLNEALETFLEDYCE